MKRIFIFFILFGLSGCGVKKPPAPYFSLPHNAQDASPTPTPSAAPSFFDMGSP